ncbi:glycoside hydrolase [Massilia sp. Root351]|jgi:beta-xylosidase|uniref:glycoside hydrolase family 43 protein n=1 Tax=Massilia sp. Root351 TaxID=1736522 RepID=UPI0007104CD3|nr:glycoside hydrolase 43 family protein [Massilia sp. Root351]KQV90293.1 glycoside hydrolase [Massilia sp. Root351]
MIKQLCMLVLAGAAGAVSASAVSTAAGPAVAQPWAADLGNGQYRNPILHADYSDPDVIRVGAMFYMTSSSFSNAPGLPLLQSTDMVNWELVGHALAQLPPAEIFAVPQPGKGVWAPALRHHDGKFWIFYPDPDAGIYVMTAEKFAGPWSAPRLILAGKGIIDPAPLWDDDGKAWLVHGWAKSRSGINNILTLRSMAPDGSKLLDEKGRDIINGDKLPGYFTIEGPKLHKAHGYYYVFAPAGGVENGWQSVFRSRSIEGPYEDRIVMAQGMSAVNGPHQGAWVDGVDGRDWFYHFQDKGAYGRVVHLQPMRWKDGWPVIGEDKDGDGVGEPVMRHAKPAGQDSGVLVPATTDEFSAKALGLQWQWNANYLPSWATLTARPGYLRLAALPAADGASLRGLPSVLTQKFPAPAFGVDASIVLGGSGGAGGKAGGADGQRAGLMVLGIRYAWVGLRRQGNVTQLVHSICEVPADTCQERSEVLASLPAGAAGASAAAAATGPVYLRLRVDAGAMAQFSYSLDNKTFTPAGRPFKASVGRWVGAQLGLFSTVPATAASKSAWVDVDYFRVTP